MEAGIDMPKASRDQERWLPVPGFEGFYEVSDLGNVRSLGRVIMRQNRHQVRRFGQLLACPKEGGGYPAVVLAKDGVKRTVRVHELVLTAFVAPRPAGLYACHNNGDRADNRLDNLRWDTPRENNLDIIRHGRHERVNLESCLRGHLLAAPNLVKTAKARVCLACARARSYRHYHFKKSGVTVELKEVSDQYYAEIMGHEAS